MLLRTFKGFITELPPNGIFVFGSNTEGIHGAGAARTALDKFGAEYGNPVGFQGQSYAIITKDLSKGMRSIPLEEIADQVEVLIFWAERSLGYEFFVTKFGCELAGYTIEEIAGTFRGKKIPPNMIFDEELARAIEKN